MGRENFSFIILILFALVFFNFCSGSNEVSEKSMDDLALDINGHFLNAGKQLIKLKGQIQTILNKEINETEKKDSTDRFRLFDNIVYYNPKKNDECAFWYSGYDEDKNILTKLSYLEKFEKYIKDAAGNENYSNSIFMISMDNIIISYPYVNFLVYLSPKTDFKVLIKKNYNENQGELIWTVPYLDVMGTGYVTSLKSFIVKNETPEYQLLIDVSIPELYKRTIKSVKTPMMILLAPHYIIAVNKSCRDLFNISGGENNFYLKDEKILSSKVTLQNLLLDKKKHPYLFEMLNDIEGTSPVFIDYLNFRYRVVKKKIDATGWLLLGFIKT